MVPEQTLIALRFISGRLENKQIKWAIVGTTSLALQGVDVVTHDIDLLTNKTGALEISKLFKEQQTEPMKYSESAHFKTYHGIYTISGIKVDVMGDLQHRTADGGWAEGSRLSRVIMAQVRDFTLPLLDLKQEYQAYLKLGRIETAKKIKEVLDKRKPKEEF